MSFPQGKEKNQQKNPTTPSVLIAIFNTSCMEVCLEIALFLNKLLLHRAGVSVLMVLHRQEQVVGQADKDKSKGRNK